MRRMLVGLALVLLSACRVAAEEPRGAAESASGVIEPCDADDTRPWPLSVVIAPDDGDGRLLGLLDGAKRTINVGIYQLTSQRVIDALKAAATRGVRVRIIQDWREVIPNILAELRGAGVEIHPSSPDFEHTHQKTVTVDGEMAFIFSGNLDGRAFVRGRNYGLFDDDEDDVYDLEQLFRDDWDGRAPDLTCTRLVVSPVNSRARVLSLAEKARATLDVEAMYIADRQVEEAIVLAHERGIAVRVLLNDPHFGTGDPTAVAARLAARGIPVRRSGDRFIHAKLLLADANQPFSRAFIGSENFSRTALDRNREVGVIVSPGDADVSRIADTFAADWASSPPFTTEAAGDELSPVE